MRRLTAAAAAAVVLLLVACSPDADDFKEEAEEYIESRGFSEGAGLLRYSEAECEEPESTAEDTMYTCTATAEDGSRWQFDVEIIGEKNLRVSIPPTLLSAAPTDSTVPEESSPASTGSAPTTTSAPRTSAAAVTTADDNCRRNDDDRRLTPASVGRPTVSRRADANELAAAYSSVVDSKEYGSPMSV